MKKTLLLSLLLACAPAAALLEGCIDDGDCQVASAPRFFDVQGVTLAPLRNAGNRPVAAGDTVATSELRLVLQLQVRYYGSSPARAGWLPAAYACPPSPIPGYEGTTEELDSVTVRTAYAYDAAHPAGALLNDLLVADNTGGPLPVTPPRDQPRPADLALRLQQPPALAGPQQFVLRYRLRNGELYTSRTPVFVLR